MRKTEVLQAHILDKIADPKDMPEGPAGWIPKECSERYAKRSERKERKIFELQWLYLHPEIVVLTSRTDKRPTIKKGWPDFTLFCNGRVLFADFKSDGKTLTEDQERVKSRLEAAGFQFFVWYSADQAIRDTRGCLGI